MSVTNKGGKEVVPHRGSTDTLRDKTAVEIKKIGRNEDDGRNHAMVDFDPKWSISTALS